MNDPWTSNRLNEDLQFKVVSAPQHYNFTTEKAVQYVSIANQTGVIGYLWVSDVDDAAGYIARDSGGDEALNAGVLWYDKLREAKAKKLSPTQALTLLSSDPGHPLTGWVVSGSQAQSPSLSALKERAAQE